MSKVEWRPVSELCALCGITQEEAVEYLGARGVKASFGAIKAWGRGNYAAPLDAVRELYELYLSVQGTNGTKYVMPPEAPEGARARHAMLSRLRGWHSYVYGGENATEVSDGETLLSSESKASEVTRGQ